MKTRDQFEAGDENPTKTMLPLGDQQRRAESALDRALTEFKIAAAGVIDRIKAGECLPKRELDREWNARLQLINARKTSNGSTAGEKHSRHRSPADRCAECLSALRLREATSNTRVGQPISSAYRLLRTLVRPLS